MRIKHIIFLLATLFFANNLYSQNIDLSQPLNKETFKIWDEYIKKNAPSQEALNVVVNMANRHKFAARAAVAYEIYSMYIALFPGYKTAIENEMKSLEEVMQSQTPASDMEYIYIKFINSNADSEKAFIAMQRLTDKFLDNKNWDSVIYVYKYFYDKFPSHKKRIDKIIGILSSPLNNLKVENIGSDINTAGDEWDPTPTVDGKYLYFSANSLSPNYGNDDIYFCTVDSANRWGKYQNLGKQINGKYNETIDNVSLDGNTIVMSGNFAGTFGEFDIYTADKTEHGWSSIYHLPMPINSKYFDEGANITPDGKAILFTSDRPGGIGEYVAYNTLFHGNAMGNMDLYVCLKTDSGWSQPINLGRNINTPYAERSPYLHPDGKTLYFSSDGHAGLGRLDVFKSVRLSDTSWTEWSEPVNLGKEINTTKDDWGYIVNLKGDTAYFSALNRKDGYGSWDIYTVTLPEFAKAEKTVTIKGKIIDRHKNIINAKVKWEDLITGKEIGISQTDPQTGEYIIVLTYGKKYGYYADADKYYPTSGSIDLTQNTKKAIIRKDIILIKEEEVAQSKEKITINNIFFDYDKYELKPESYSELNRLVLFLKKFPDNKIVIQGHTDKVGAKQYNLNLSKKRAEAVAQYLINKGIQENNLKTEGYGYSKPLATNPEHMYINRRVEILIK